MLLRYGMGVDSTAILLRWMLEPASRRNFPLSDLVALTAQTGDEYPDTKRDVEAHVLPRMREAGVRFVQVARAGLYEKSGIVVLADTTAPTALHTEGAYKLSEEMTAAGTIPARRSGQKLCTQKFKGWVLDRWIAGAGLDGAGVRHAIGFESEETERVEKDKGYTRNDIPTEYPLVEWGWNRQRCIDYIREVTGITWRKSACVFCPFASLKGSGCVDRYREDPDSAVKALLLEAASLMLNPRVGLFSGRTLRQVVEKSGNHEAMSRFRTALDGAEEWAVYRVRRAYTAPAKAFRELTTMFRGSRSACQGFLDGSAPTAGASEVDEHGFERLYTLRREDGVYPTREEMFVVGPAGIADKVLRTAFDKAWARAGNAA